MSILAEAFNPRAMASSPDVMSDFWYTRDPSGFIAEAGGGIGISPETILRCTTVLAAVRFRGDSWAMCPPSTYRKTATGREEVPGHYSQLVLRDPNKWQTGNRWRHLMGVHLATWGNAYSRIVSGPRSWAEELWPIHPSLIRLIEQHPDGTLEYRYTPKVGAPETLFSGDLIHFRDLSTDGFEGAALYRLIRNVVSIALLAERHEETFLRKGTRVSGLLTTAAPLTSEKRQELKDSVNSDFSGPSQTGALGILPHGVELKPLSLGARVEQRAELTDQNIGSILRGLGVPGVVVGYAEKTATYASAKEFFESGGIKHCVLPILTNIEAEEEKALLPRGSGLQIKHNLDVLMRANWKDRIDGLVKATGGPIFAVNESRRIEDLERLDDPIYDKPYVPSNMMGGESPEDPSAPPPTRPRPAPEPFDDGGDEAGKLLPFPVAVQPVAVPFAQAPSEALPESVTTVFNPLADKARAFAVLGAERVLRREREAIVAKSAKFARDLPGWRAFVATAYTDHAAYVASTLLVDEPAAKAYCDGQAAALLAGGVVVAETWDSEIAPRLVALALGEA